LNWQVPSDAFGELRVSNALLADREALQAAWAADGYWFFRGVLDVPTLERFREIYLEQLVEGGWIAPGDAEARYTGKSLADFPGRMEPLVERRPAPWRDFVRQPPIDSFFRELLGDAPYWIPNTDYRATPPTTDASERFTVVHQDGFYNDGIEFLTCWIPLSRITPDIGGLSVAEAQHHSGYLHDLSQPPAFPVPTTAVPPTSWRRTTYELGDLVVFHPATPHTGWTNLSDRFRLSLDVRVMRSSAHRPIIGVIVSVASGEIAVEQDDGGLVALRFDETTYCRGVDARRVPHDRIASVFLPGQHVIISHQGGLARNLRHSH
jgi:hypothetical protein